MNAMSKKASNKRRNRFRVLKSICCGLLIIVLLAGAKRVFQSTFEPPVVDENLRARALALHQRAIVVDGHNDLPEIMADFGFRLEMNGAEEDDKLPWLYWTGLFDRPGGEHIATQTDFGRIEQGGLDAQFFAIYVGAAVYDAKNPTSGSSKARAMKLIEAVRSQTARSTDKMALAVTTTDVRRISAEGKFAALMGIEGGHAIENSLENLREFFRLGVRYMTLTWSFTHTWADSSGDIDNDEVPHHGGLTDFGREVVREMNRLGMIVDISHVADDTFWDVLEVTDAPIMASHSSARAVADTPRNLSDKMLWAVAKNNGVVLVNFFPCYIDPKKTTASGLILNWLWRIGDSGTPVGILVDHIDHIVKVAGVDHVGLGSDFDGIPFTPQGLEDVSRFPNITIELVRRGYSDDDIIKILGGNTLRVLEAVECAAASKQ